MRLHLTANSFVFGRINHENVPMIFLVKNASGVLPQRVNFTAKSFVFGRINRENGPRIFSFKHCKRRTFKMRLNVTAKSIIFGHINRENASELFYTAHCSMYLPRPEHGLNREDMTRTSLNKITKLCLVKFSFVKENASKFCMCWFSNFLSAGVQKKCRKCRFSA